MNVGVLLYKEIALGSNSDSITHEYKMMEILRKLKLTYRFKTRTTRQTLASPC